MTMLFSGEKVYDLVIQSESLHPKYEWKVTLMPWAFGAEKVVVSQFNYEEPMKIFPGTASLIRNIGLRYTGESVVYLIAKEDFDNVMELKSRIK